MGYSGFFAASTSKSKMGFLIDTGFDVLNQTIDAFLIFALVAAMRVAVLEAYQSFSKGNFSKEKLKQLFKKMCEEGAYWGAIVALYVALVYGIEMTHILGNWKSGVVGGALTGAAVSSACNNGRDKVVEDAITGGAIAAAVAFLKYLT